MVAAVACGDSTGLPPASIANYVDTATLYALRGTPIATPSGYDIPYRGPSRTDLGSTFDFVFDIDDADVPQLLPAKLLGRSTVAGIQPADEPFDAVLEAPLDGYVSDSAFTIAIGMTFIARSRTFSQNCGYVSGLPRYGKFRVLAIDDAQRTVTFEALVNLNCGYRQLEPGLPTD